MCVDSHRKRVRIVGFRCDLQPLPPSFSPTRCEGPRDFQSVLKALCIICWQALRVCYSLRHRALTKKRPLSSHFAGGDGGLPTVSSWPVVAPTAALGPRFSAVGLWGGGGVGWESVRVATQRPSCQPVLGLCPGTHFLLPYCLILTIMGL